MSFKDLIKGVVGAVAAGTAPTDPAEIARQEARSAAWQTALSHNEVPEFVSHRLRQTSGGLLPWVSTASPGDLLTLRTHGVRALGMVAGNCWYHFGYSWTEGHRDGWRTAIARMQHEAALMGAHAIVEVRLNTRQSTEADDRYSMDYSATGTAIAIAGMPAERTPMVATVSQIEFSRLIEAGILPIGLAVGAHYEWMSDPYGWAEATQSQFNQEIEVLAAFQMRVRRAALDAMISHAQAQRGTGVLGRVQFTEMFREAAERDEPKQYLCRHIAFGTVIQHNKSSRESIRPRALLMTRKPTTRSLEAGETII